jgi:hypothetical protein
MDKNLYASGWRMTRNKPDVLLVYDVDIQKEVRNIQDPVYSQPMTTMVLQPVQARLLCRSTILPSFLGYNNRQETVNAGTLTLTIMNAEYRKNDLAGMDHIRRQWPPYDGQRN